MKINPVYCYGMISPSTVHILNREFTFPGANEYAEIAETLPSIGGEAVNSAIMLSKLGIRTKLDGNWLNDKRADMILGLLKPFDIDTDRLTVKAGWGTEEVVIADRHSRTVFGNYAAFHNGPKQWNDPQEADIENASMVSLDPYFREESRLVAGMCVRHGKGFVINDCQYDDYMAQHAGAVIISHELRDQSYPGEDMDKLFRQYQIHCSGLIIFTFGSKAVWYGRRNQEKQIYTPYKIEPVDTTGAGDSFRAGIVYGFLQSWDDRSIVDFASAVAACVCLTYPHTLNAPGLDGVQKLMNKHKSR